MARKVKNEKKQLQERLARALADYDNLVKRVNREKEELVLRANKNLFEALLPAIDDLERAQEYLKDEGLAMALKQFKKVLKEHGVEEIPTKPGDEFNSQIHEALEAVEGGKEGTVAKVLLKGYRWKDETVLRPVKVRVYGEKPEKEDELDQELTRGDYV